MNKYKAVKLSSILGVCGNVFLLVIKGIVGFITKSQAMIADFFNSAGDVFSSIMTFIGNRVASKPGDDCHNLGHGKAEYIYSMLISITMAFTAYKVMFNSFVSLVKHKSYVFSIWLVVVCLITIFVKLGLFIYTNLMSKKYKTLLLKANSQDHRNDCILTLLNLLACLLSLKKIYFIDGIVGMIIAIWIFICAVKIFLESYDVLMDKAIDVETRGKVYEIIHKHSEVIKVNHFNSTPVGYRYQISFTIFVDGDLTTFESHDIANNLEKEISKEIDEVFLTIIHVNPVHVDKKG